jgi:hypothetical protein
MDDTDVSQLDQLAEEYCMSLDGIDIQSFARDAFEILRIRRKHGIPLEDLTGSLSAIWGWDGGDISWAKQSDGKPILDRILEDFCEQIPAPHGTPPGTVRYAWKGLSPDEDPDVYISPVALDAFSQRMDMMSKCEEAIKEDNPVRFLSEKHDINPAMAIGMLMEYRRIFPG